MGLLKKFVNQTRKPEGMLGKLMYPERFCEEVVRFLEETGWEALDTAATINLKKSCFSL